MDFLAHAMLCMWQAFASDWSLRGSLSTCKSGSSRSKKMNFSQGACRKVARSRPLSSISILSTNDARAKTNESDPEEASAASSFPTFRLCTKHSVAQHVSLLTMGDWPFRFRAHLTKSIYASEHNHYHGCVYQLWVSWESATQHDVEDHACECCPRRSVQIAKSGQDDIDIQFAWIDQVQLIGITVLSAWLISRVKTSVSKYTILCNCTHHSGDISRICRVNAARPNRCHAFVHGQGARKFVESSICIEAIRAHE